MTEAERDRLLDICAVALRRTFDEVPEAGQYADPLDSTARVLREALETNGHAADEAWLLAFGATADAFLAEER